MAPKRAALLRQRDKHGESVERLRAGATGSGAVLASWPATLNVDEAIAAAPCGATQRATSPERRPEPDHSTLGKHPSLRCAGQAGTREAIIARTSLPKHINARRGSNVSRRRSGRPGCRPRPRQRSIPVVIVLSAVSQLKEHTHELHTVRTLAKPVELDTILELAAHYDA